MFLVIIIKTTQRCGHRIEISEIIWRDLSSTVEIKEKHCTQIKLNLGKMRAILLEGFFNWSIISFQSFLIVLFLYLLLFQFVSEFYDAAGF